jgi:hypothetical protein
MPSHFRQGPKNDFRDAQAIAEAVQSNQFKESATRKNFMLKTRITEQYGLQVPFINAGMAFIATAPLARAVCKAGGMGMLGTPAM